VLYSSACIGPRYESLHKPLVGQSWRVVGSGLLRKIEVGEDVDRVVALAGLEEHALPSAPVRNRLVHSALFFGSLFAESGDIETYSSTTPSQSQHGLTERLGNEMELETRMQGLVAPSQLEELDDPRCNREQFLGLPLHHGVLPEAIDH